MDLKTSFCLEYELYIFSSDINFMLSAFVLLSSSLVSNLLLRHANCSLVRSEVLLSFFQHTDDTDTTDQNGSYFISQNIDIKTSVFICSIRVIRVLFAQQRTER